MNGKKSSLRVVSLQRVLFDFPRVVVGSPPLLSLALLSSSTYTRNHPLIPTRYQLPQKTNTTTLLHLPTLPLSPLRSPFTVIILLLASSPLPLSILHNNLIPLNKSYTRPIHRVHPPPPTTPTTNNMTSPAGVQPPQHRSVFSLALINTKQSERASDLRRCVLTLVVLPPLSQTYD